MNNPFGPRDSQKAKETIANEKKKEKKEKEKEEKKSERKYDPLSHWQWEWGKGIEESGGLRVRGTQKLSVALSLP